MSWHPQYQSSKFRHIFGKSASKNCYDFVPITHSVPDHHFCAVNPDFIAVMTECTGGGAFLVIPLHRTGKLDPHYLKVCGHRGNVLDVKWNPFNDCKLASCPEDAMITIWDIPKQLLTKNLTAFRKELVGHAHRVGLVEWHPTAANILFSSGYDYKVMIWNLNSKESVIMSPVKTINCHQDMILSMSFNTNGSLLASACKDCKIRVLDSRAGAILQEANRKAPGQQSAVSGEPAEAAAHRHILREQLADGPRGLGRPLCACHRGGPNGPSGVLFPFYDADTNMLSVVGKGDRNIHYYEISANKPRLTYPLERRSYDPQQGVGVMPKRGLDVSS